MNAPLTTRYLSEADYAAWARLVAASAEGSIYSTPEYLDVLCAVAGGRFRLLAAERAGELLGGIALYEQSCRWGTYVSCRLLLYYNGFVLAPHSSKYPSERTARRIEVLTALEQAVAQAGYGRVLFRNRSPLTDARVFQARGWMVWPSYTYVAPIADLEALWGRVEQNLRRLVQRCTRQALQMTEDEDFESFYRMHLQTHERKGTPLYLPRPGFEQYFRRLRAQGLATLFHSRLPGGRAISTQLVLLGLHPVSHSVSAAADFDFLKTGATAFLRWKVFEELSRRGYSGNDLTDAALNPVTHFKSQLGGDLEVCLNLRLPDAPGFRLSQAASDLYLGARGAAGKLARRVMRRHSEPSKRGDS